MRRGAIWLSSSVARQDREWRYVEAPGPDCQGVVRASEQTLIGEGRRLARRDRVTLSVGASIYLTQLMGGDFALRAEFVTLMYQSIVGK